MSCWTLASKTTSASFGTKKTKLFVKVIYPRKFLLQVLPLVCQIVKIPSNENFFR